MDNKPFFSIVMPTYAVEKYLAKAIECILDQSFCNWELLIVDDCSPDSCGAIAERYSEKDERIIVIHSDHNNGVSKSRNVGMLRASGDFEWFPDPDDIYERDLLERVFQSVKRYPSVPLVMFGHAENWYNRKGEFSHRVLVPFCKSGYLTRQELRDMVMNWEESTQYGYPWNKVYSLSYLKENNILFREISYIEDIDFNIKVFQNLPSVVLLKDILYKYAKRPSISLTGKYDSNFFNLHRERILLLYRQQLSWNDGKISKDFYSRLGLLFCKYVVASLRMNCYSDSMMSHRERKHWCFQLYENSFNYSLIKQAASSNNKIFNTCIACIKRKQINLMLAIGRTAYLVERYFYPLISRLKTTT